MQIDFLSVYENTRNYDILYGGDANLSIQSEIFPFIDFENENDVNACKYLLVQFMYYIFHACFCYDRLVAGDTAMSLKMRGYTSDEVATATRAFEEYGERFDKCTFTYMANEKITMICTTIEKILDNESTIGVPKGIVDSANMRIDFAKRHPMNRHKERFGIQ
mgnify:CR=1 FL=1